MNGIKETLPNQKYESISWTDKDELMIEGCRVRDIAAEFGTPVYVISENQLINNARLYQQEFGDRWPEGKVRILPAIKANFTLATRNILTQEGCGCDVFSPSELWAALQSGIDPAMISLNGHSKLGKNNNIIREAVEKGIKITIDQPEEYDLIIKHAQELGKKAVIRFRLRAEFESLRMPTQYMTGLAMPVEYTMNMYKQGIPFETVIELGKKALSSPHVHVSGVHIHTGRHRRDPAYWGAIMAGYVEMLAKLKKEWNGWEPEEIDIGGGIPSRRDPHCGVNVLEGSLPPVQPFEDVVIGDLKGEDRLQKTNEFNSVLRHLYKDFHQQEPLRPIRLPLAAYAEVITDTLRRELLRHGMEPEGKILEIEPGRGMYADAGVHLASITVMKEQTYPCDWRWLYCDTVQTFLGNIVTEHALYHYLFDGLPRKNWNKTVIADIVGRSCNLDQLVPHAVIPAGVGPDNILMFLDTGAYEDPNSSNFNGLPRPATILVSGDSAEVIKKAETMEEVFSRDVIPDRLAVR